MGFFNPFSGLGGGKKTDTGNINSVYGFSVGVTESTTDVARQLRPTLILHCSEIRGAEETYVQLAELKFYNKKGELINISEYNPTISCNLIAVNAQQSIETSIDNDITTVFCAYWNATTGLTITLESDYSDGIGYFSYVTGADMPARDMISFTIDYYWDAQTSRILDVSNASISTNRQTETQLFPCDE